MNRKKYDDELIHRMLAYPKEQIFNAWTVGNPTEKLMFYREALEQIEKVDYRIRKGEFLAGELTKKHIIALMKNINNSIEKLINGV